MDDPIQVLSSITHFYAEVSKVQFTEDLVDDLQAFGIRDHGVILPCNVKIL